MWKNKFNVAPTAIFFIRNFLIFRLIIFSESLWLLCLLCCYENEQKKLFSLSFSFLLFLGSKNILGIFSSDAVDSRLFFASLPYFFFEKFSSFVIFSFSQFFIPFLRMEIDVEKLALINNKNTFSYLCCSRRFHCIRN